MNLQPPKPLRTFTVPQVAQILQLDKKHVYVLLQSGRLYGRKIGPGRTSKWRVPEVSLEKYLAGYEDTSIDVN